MGPSRIRRRRAAIWYHPLYRLPIPGLDEVGGLDLRRADLVAWSLGARGILEPGALREPEPAPYGDLARVHTPAYLESLARAETLGRIFAVDPSQVPPDETLHSVRLAVGGTVAATREALAGGRATLNLLGGFHHAAPDRGGGLCALNDVAIALAAVRDEGFAGRAVVLDLDAHPPDGTAACLRSDPAAWIGSLSGSDFGPPEGVDEVVLPPGTSDRAYLAALDQLLGRMPRPALAFVIAGGDVLADDRFGRLGLSLDGARERDLRVAAALDGLPAVWLPGGGYHEDAWRVLGGTALALFRGSRRPIAREPDPLSARFAGIAAGLPAERLRDSAELTQEDIDAALLGPPRRRTLLGYYGAEGVEYALGRYGVLALVERLGYRDLRIEIEGAPQGGDRARLFGRADGVRHLLIEIMLDREAVLGRDMLYVHWLTLRNPRARFDARRPALPGQEMPGLGLAREITELLDRMAERLDLGGVAFRPAHFHTAYVARRRFRFVDAARQGRFEALLRDLAAVPLAEATRAIAAGRVQQDGAPYRWEPDVMAAFREGAPEDAEAVARERERVRFSLAPG